MTTLIQVSSADGVMTIVLNNGKVNAVSPDLIAEINSALDQAEQEKSMVVLTGQPGMFSGGYDLKYMQQGMDKAMHLVTLGSTLGRRLLAFPQPVIGACSGHAIAKGSFLLLCCDYRIGVRGPFKLGLNETAIGMTMHHAGITMARQRLPHHYFHRCVVNAEMFSPDEAVAPGFLDVVVEPDQFEGAIQMAVSHFKSLNRRAFTGAKLKTREQLLKTMDWAIAEDQKASS
jgi:enoyl-CoA hydratase